MADGATITANVSSGAVLSTSTSTKTTVSANVTTGGKGNTGDAGPGVPTGGTTGQVLRKVDGDDYDTEWHTPVKSDVGLDNVDNTSDLNKPISTSTQAALDAKVSSQWVDDTDGIEYTVGNVGVGAASSENYRVHIAGTLSAATSGSNGLLGVVGTVNIPGIAGIGVNFSPVVGADTTSATGLRVIPRLIPLADLSIITGINNSVTVGPTTGSNTFIITNAYMNYIRATLVAQYTGTISNLYGNFIENPSNSGATITKLVGQFIKEHTAGTNNTNLLIGGTSAPTGNYSIYNASTRANYFAGDIVVPDEAYGAGWDGSLEVPTKNALYDKVSSLTKSDVGLGNADNTSDATKNSATATLSNKILDNTNAITVKDVNLTIQDDADTTRQAKFNASSISAGTTRTISLPNVSDTLVARSSTDTLTNKSIDLASNTVTMTEAQLNTAVTDGDVVFDDNITLGKPRTDLISGKRSRVSVGPSATVTAASGTVNYQPFIPSVSTTLTLLEIEVVTTAGSAGSVVRMGLYADDGTGTGPGSLITDFGTTATTSTGIKTISISQAVTRGTIYWFAVAAQGAPATNPILRTVTSNNWPSALSTAPTNLTGITPVGSAAGALPTTASVTSATASIYALAVRI